MNPRARYDTPAERFGAWVVVAVCFAGIIIVGAGLTLGWWTT